ncbi:MAG: A/G-specific adenine glycosylase [Rhodoferax sp.]|nr:A/G-specific adenine glycosylase [Rhodoferax sp.]
MPGRFPDEVVAWQARSGRHDLPWQNTRDPYRVWLSEVMLQQTQVATVRVYFARFLERLPTVAALAAASQDEVLGLWSGLGYYSRARNLHRCAQAVVAQHGGVFPPSSQVLQTLPGIGRSTAAAIASLCFGERVAILDANVKRVLARVLGFEDDLASLANERKLWTAATELLPRTDPVASMPRYTQGMMDLGATVCLPRAPVCGSCPVSTYCMALRLGTPERFPVKTRTLKRSALSVWLLWLQRRDGSVWLQRRPQAGVWAGLYCFPSFDSRAALEQCLPDRLSGQATDLPAFKHVLTHKDLYLHPVLLQMPRSVPPGMEGQWFGPGQWPGLGLPAPIRQLLVQACSQPNEVEG